MKHEEAYAKALKSFGKDLYEKGGWASCDQDMIQHVYGLPQDAVEIVCEEIRACENRYRVDLVSPEKFCDAAKRCRTIDCIGLRDDQHTGCEAKDYLAAQHHACDCADTESIFLSLEIVDTWSGEIISSCKLTGVL